MLNAHVKGGSPQSPTATTPHPRAPKIVSISIKIDDEAKSAGQKKSGG